MAHGRKRICLGSMMLAFAFLAGAGSIASRWYRFEAHRLGSSRFLSLGLYQGNLRLSMGRAQPYLRQYFADGWSTETSETEPEGPHLFLLPENPAPTRDWNLRGNRYIEIWSLASYRSASGAIVFRAVDWPIITSGAMSGGFLLLRGLRARRRHRLPHLCPKCNYDRSATPTQSPCPECGTVPPSPRATSAPGEVPEGR